MFIKEVRDEPLPEDPFKTNRLIEIVPRSSLITDKPGHVNSLDFYSCQKVPPHKTQMRWADHELLCQSMETFFDGKGPGHHPLNSDNYPLPSSVNKDGVFKDFPVGKSLNYWEKKIKHNISNSLKESIIKNIKRSITTESKKL